jgi:hypothetical protein
MWMGRAETGGGGETNRQRIMGTTRKRAGQRARGGGEETEWEQGRDEKKLGCRGGGGERGLEMGTEGPHREGETCGGRDLKDRSCGWCSAQQMPKAYHFVYVKLSLRRPKLVWMFTSDTRQVAKEPDETGCKQWKKRQTGRTHVTNVTGTQAQSRNAECHQSIPAYLQLCDIVPSEGSTRPQTHHRHHSWHNNARTSALPTTIVALHNSCVSHTLLDRERPCGCPQHSNDTYQLDNQTVGDLMTSYPYGCQHW